MNISINESKQRPVDQQAAEQTILLNAIKNKFANNENHSGTSPPVFSIPSLKFPQLSSKSSSMDSSEKAPLSKLNQFILVQLAERDEEAIAKVGSFKIPNLTAKKDFDTPSLTFAEKLNLHQTKLSEIKINSLNKDISNLRICEEQKPHVIDLTTALNQSTTLPASPAKQITTTPNPIDFQIPFIDCDLKEANLQLPLRDEHCLTDVSDYVYRRFISAPSKFGKITCLKYRLPKAAAFVDHSFLHKHKINRFGFDTKSPDDIILGSLRRCNKV